MLPFDYSSAENSEYTQRQQMAIKALMDSFNEDQTPELAMLLALQASENLPRETSAGQAAIDRLIDLTKRHLNREPSAIIFLREAIKKAGRGSELEAKGLTYYFNHVRGMRDLNEKAREALHIMWALKDSPPQLLKLWSGTVQDLIEQEELEDALHLVVTAFGSPLTKGMVIREAQNLWPEIIDKMSETQSYIKSIRGAQHTMIKLCEASTGPEDFAEMKEAAAAKLLDLSMLVRKPEFSYQAIMAAASYDGYNMPLHTRIATKLMEISESSFSTSPDVLMNSAIVAYQHAEPQSPLSEKTVRQYSTAIDAIMKLDMQRGLDITLDHALIPSLQGELEKEAIRLHINKVEDIKRQDPYKAFNILYEEMGKITGSQKIREAFLYKFFEFSDYQANANNYKGDAELAFAGVWNASILSDSYPDLAPHIIDRLIDISGILINQNLDLSRRAANRAYEMAEYRQDQSRQQRALSALHRSGLSEPPPPGFQP
jgi:hypothetical protein